jgi:formylglycine-generating enzyme required for sulfatase activity
MPQGNVPRAPRKAPTKNMVWIPGGEFLMGSEQFYPDERPLRETSVDGSRRGVQ